MKLFYTELARNDLRTLRDYIARENSQAAVTTSRYIRSRLHDLAILPLTGRSGRLMGTRELFMRRHPYVAVYEVDRAAATVVILRVLHTRQDWPRMTGPSPDAR